ncbi:MAG: Kae1-like domain-containing protein, partial [Endomicrobiales bacterium]
CRLGSCRKPGTAVRPGFPVEKKRENIPDRAFRSKALDFLRKKVYNFEVVSGPENDGPRTVSTAGIIRGVWEDVKAGEDPGIISLKFHLTLTEIIAHLAGRFGRIHRINDVVLSGGVFQNRLLLALTGERLKSSGFNVHFNRVVPANDGGISLGQAWVALKTVV